VLAAQGKISFGVIVAFMLYIRNFTYPLQNISQALQSVQSMAAACERVFEFLDEEEMEDESKKTAVLNKIKGDVSFDHVRFGYNPDKIIIHDFSSRVKAGQKIAIVGPTGAGKTTIVNLLMRFYETNSGSISIDGIPIAGLKRENLHDLFGMVLQDTWMFEGTVRENLVYNKESVSDKKLDEVCRDVGLIDLIDQLSDRYDTMLGDNVSLSAGQKQLFTIARAMIEDAPLLILDEATSSVDTRTELQVQKAMDMLTQGRTSFVIAHRLSTIKNADCILVMKDGDIIESGSHDTLLAKGGFYAELYNSQFEQAS
ncbi:MAG: ABC transporter ATP-binding protein, partial [Candidatus Ornithomonoglobus sp.]